MISLNNQFFLSIFYQYYNIIMISKNVRFSNTIQVKIIPSRFQEQRGIIKYLFNGTISNNNNANLIITKIINSLSPHKIIIAYDEDMPLKISSENRDWYEDNSAIIILDKFQIDKIFLYRFIEEYNNMINKYIVPKTSSKIKYKSFYKDFYISINSVTHY